MAKLLTSTAVPTTPWRAAGADDGYGAGAEPDWRGVDWQERLRSVEIGGRRVNYVDTGSGDGPPVVFVHGLSGQWQNWLENIPYAALDRRVVALDLPGFGRSEEPDEGITIPGYGRCVEALCERLGLGRVALVGNSMGGLVSAEVAIQFPERVDRVALVSAAGITSANVYRAPVQTAGRIGSAMIAYTASRHRSMAKRPITRHLAVALVTRHPSKLKADLVYQGLMLGVGTPGFDDGLRACLTYDFRDRLPEIACRTLIVWGENDAILPAHDAREFERLIPDSRMELMEDTGHMPQIERPQAFNELLSDFLST